MFNLYRFATSLDKFCIFMGVIQAIISGICLTLVNLTFGTITGVIIDYVTVTSNTTNSTAILVAQHRLSEATTQFAVFNCALGVATLVSSYISTILFNYSAIRQTFRIRNLFFKSVLNQDIAWYDVRQTGDFATRVSDDLKKIEDGIGEKVAILTLYVAVFVANLGQALFVGWELALVCMISFPLTALCLGIVALVSTNLAKTEIEAYSGAGVVAEETLSAIRTVIAFEGQHKEQSRYDTLLRQAKSNNLKRSLLNSIVNGIMWFITYASFSLAFWYGVKLILSYSGKKESERKYDAGIMITVFFSVLTGFWYFGMIEPFVETLGAARGAAESVFSVIASKPVINASKGTGVRPRRLRGHIRFRKVYFSYPSRQEVKILHKLSIKIKAGETVALVGGSGCGKSTLIQLIQRYYDPHRGDVYLDNYNLKDFDLSWVRERIGVVGQEPILFESTIGENIRFGYPQATQEEIEEASRQANAHGFITTLPQGYYTMVGERGAQLSGGQKQRIAIARALVRKPVILLLDEATSALDTNSEAIVQAALDQARSGRTTVIVAHRLSTVQSADKIVVLAKGEVVEQGTHDELISLKGAYFQLVSAQLTTDVISPKAHKEQQIEVKLEPQAMQIQSNRLSTNFSFRHIQVKYSEDEELTNKSPLWEMMKYNSPEWWLLVIGCLSAVVTGAIMPAYSVIFGDLLGVLSNNDLGYVQSQTSKYCQYFFILGIVSGVTMFVQMYSFDIAGERLSMRLRSKMFGAILRQEVSWFDKKENGVGSLCARLSGEPASVQGATGLRIGSILNAVSTICISVAISFYFEWRISLVAICFTPILILSIYLEQQLMTKELQGQHSSMLNSTKIAVEAISNIRTIASLGCEQLFYDRYVGELHSGQSRAKTGAHFRAIVYGFSRCLTFFSYAAAILYGVLLIRNEKLNYEVVFIVTETLISGSWSIANTLAFTPNFQAGLIAADKIIQLLNRTSEIQSGSNNPNERWEVGNILYDQVRFTYPTRPDIQVLNGLNLAVHQGTMVALVGPSGCGKSTIIQLLERFYDPSEGSVNVDGNDLRYMHLSALRSHLGIVSQEPNLFSKTLAENIAYGDNSRVVPMHEIIKAAKKANIHNFIQSLPLGYNTQLGSKGTQLSGGQKQRVAIARALVRNPKVLLLDEATSALDAESEKVVQNALDSAMKGRTCISIAHRLTTIQDADVICVINNGELAEMGTHVELLNLRGIYYNLYSTQQRSGHGVT